MPVSLQEIVDALQMQNLELPYWLDTQTGEVAPASTEDLHLAESVLKGMPEGRLPDEDAILEAGAPEWQVPQIQWALSLVTEGPPRFRKLPTAYDIHEWRILRDFVEGLSDSPLRDQLERAIHARGAFRRAKDILDDNDRLAEWFEFKQNAMKRIALDWCKEEEIEAVDDMT